MSVARARVAVAALVVAAATAACGSDGPATVRIDMRYSKFEPARFSANAGDTVRLVLVNHDPIAHELIIGDESVQQAHEIGTDRTHDGMPGQASLEPGETQTIEYRVPAGARTLIYGCHRPGHYRYGMKGELDVRA